MIECSCGRWTFREIDLSTGLGVSEKHCPRCNRTMLLVFRGPDYLGAVELQGRDAGSLEEALSACRLSSAEVALLVTVARLMASASARR